MKNLSKKFLILLFAVVFAGNLTFPLVGSAQGVGGCPYGGCEPSCECFGFPCGCPSGPTGSITVCKIVIDPENNIVDGSEISGAEFSISGFTPNPLPSTGFPAGVIPNSTFITPLSFTDDLIGNDGVDDAECITYSNLALGGYYYDEEVLPTEGWEIPLYNDQFTAQVDDLNDFFEYDNKLFDGNYLNDEERDTNADGHIVLSESRPDRTLVVLNQYEEIPPATIVAYKVVCDNEEDLPNWTDSGTGAPSMIDENTAIDYVAQHPNCHLESNWDFQWGFQDKSAADGVDKLAGDHIGPADGTISTCPANCGVNTQTGSNYNNWKNFDISTGETVPATVEINDFEDAPGIWVRENLKEGYIPFTYPPKTGTEDNVTAEIYCYTDVYNYDNYDLIESPEMGETYYCVAFNALKPYVCNEQSADWSLEPLDIVDIGDETSETYHPIDGWSEANLPGNYGGCQQGAVCSYRQVIENPCTAEETQATAVLHAGTNMVTKLEIKHLDGISLSDGFDIYINNTYVATWVDETQIQTEVWRETEFDISSFEFSGELTVKLVATDNIWSSCPTYGQVAIDWISIHGCGNPWEPPQEPICDISGLKFNDLNENGQKDTEESGLEGWTIQLKSPTACEQGEEWADSVVSYNPGNRKDGTPIVIDRTDPNNALGEAQNNDTINFVSLGFGGELILEFDNYIFNGSGNDIEVIETSYGSPSCANYPEMVRVYASQNGTGWTDLGNACLDAEFDLGILPWAKYLKFIDESDSSSSRFPSSADGYDIDGVRALNCVSDWEVIDERITDSFGNYCFDQIVQGSYLLEEVLQEGWHATVPINPPYFEFYFTPGDELVFDFGNKEDELEQPICGNGIIESGEECEKDGDCYCGNVCVNCHCETPPVVCDPKIELVTNMGFEEPIVETSEGWDIFENVFGWLIEWLSDTPSTWQELARPTASLEIHRGVNSWDSQGGSYQHVELDGDWYGPGDSQSGEPASTVISQEIDTIPGEWYDISFYFSPRPNTPLYENNLEFDWNDGDFIDTTIQGAGENNTTWTEYTYILQATGDKTQIKFSDIGFSNSEGTFLDTVSVRCHPEYEPGPTCTDNDGDGYSIEGENCGEVDCNDSDPSINPGANEICNNQIDDNCDGYEDCNDSQCVENPICEIVQPECEPRETRDCDTGLYGACSIGVQTCDEFGFWLSACAQVYQPMSEVCGDGIDNDCNGSVDENCTGGPAAVLSSGGGGTPGYCGDGRTQSSLGEECDDDNNINGDGCSSTCKIEEGHGGEQGEGSEGEERGEVAGESIIRGASSGPTQPRLPDTSGLAGVFAEGGEEENEPEEIPEDTSYQEENQEGEMQASVFGVLASACYDSLPLWIVLIFALYALLKAIFDKKGKKPTFWIIWFVVLIILFAVFYFADYKNIDIWVGLILGLITLIIWLLTSNKAKKALIFTLGLIVLLVFLIVWLVKGCLYLWLILLLLAIYFIISLLMKTRKEQIAEAKQQTLNPEQGNK